MSSNRRNGPVSSRQQPKKQSNDPLKIDPLNDLDWKAVEPTKYRPFKPIYHITMGRFLRPLTHVAYMRLHSTANVTTNGAQNSTEDRYTFGSHHHRHRLP